MPVEEGGWWTHRRCCAGSLFPPLILPLRYRKSFDFGTGTVFNWPGEYFGGGEVFADPATGQIHLAWGKTTVQAYKVQLAIRCCAGRSDGLFFARTGCSSVHHLSGNGRRKRSF